MSKIIPNSFQTPNAYIDEFMAFLTPEENVVLTYTARRIFGFHKDEDRISLSQYAEGIKAHDGSILDYGTGLNKKAVRRALDALIAFGLIIEVEPYVIETSTPACYALQLDPEKIDSSGLHARRAARVAMDSRRTAKGRNVATLNRAERSDPSVSDNTPPVLSHTTAPPVLSDTTPPVLSDSIPPVVSDTTTKAREKQSRKPEEPLGESAHASPQSPSPKSRTSKSPPDPRSQHPAIQLVKKLMSRYPDKIWYDDIIEIVGEEPDVGKLTACRKDWIGRGWNSNSLDWIPWYRDGIPERNGNGKQSNGSGSHGKSGESSEVSDATRKVSGRFQPTETVGSSL